MYITSPGTTVYSASGTTTPNSNSYQIHSPEPYPDTSSSYYHMKSPDSYQYNYESSQHEAASFTTTPFVPTPDSLSRYEYNKTPSGNVLQTLGNQTVEFFSGVANLPQECHGY